MSKHTPGPWFIDQTLGQAVCCVGRVRIAADKFPGTNTEPDARLIAAAPDLLEALKGVLTQHHSPDSKEPEIVRAFAAISKAVQS